MMKQEKILKLLALGILVSSTQLLAEMNKFYMGIGLASETTQSYLYKEDPLAGIVLKAGYDINDNLSAEVRFSQTIGSEVQLKHDYSMGIYLKPKMMLNNEWTAYGLFGYGMNKISFPTQNQTTNETEESDFAYGLGLEYAATDVLSVFIEGVQMVDSETTIDNTPYGINVKGIYVGAKYHFGASNDTPVMAVLEDADIIQEDIIADRNEGLKVSNKPVLKVARYNTNSKLYEIKVAVYRDYRDLKKQIAKLPYATRNMIDIVKIGDLYKAATKPSANKAYLSTQVYKYRTVFADAFVSSVR